MNLALEARLIKVADVQAQTVEIVTIHIRDASERGSSPLPQYSRTGRSPRWLIRLADRPDHSG